MERRAFRIPGFLMLLILLAVIGAAIWYSAQVIQTMPEDETGPRVGLAVAAMVLVFILVSSGFAIVNPNEARVVQFFGRYVGSVTRPGFHWVVPSTMCTSTSSTSSWHRCRWARPARLFFLGFVLAADTSTIRNAPGRRS